MTTKGRLIFLVDVINALVFTALATTGFIMEWGIPGGPQNRGRTLLSLTKHDWSELHFIIALIFVAGVLAHLALHLGYIKASLKPKP